MCDKRGNAHPSSAMPAHLASSPPGAAAAAASAGLPSQGRSGERLRCRVSSDAEELQLLHEVYGWIPGEANVRPPPAVRAQKELLLSNLDQMWASASDWVFHHVFDAPTTRNSSGKPQTPTKL